MPATTMTVFTIGTVLIPAGLILYEKKPALFTAENALKLLDISVTVLDKVVAILEAIKTIGNVYLETKGVYDKMKKAEKTARDQWSLQLIPCCQYGRLLQEFHY
ncbi:hypothetical protein BO79DRAFT_283826 [Aspergillus costaricaensis CBS 115574]|uniref:Uncharacterized protein n=1 Tax=Aspergillus costaricaensis CBS 115574 TaxID=1448317 RepID=A0ACD1IVS8_9EURO|nr:hypothetical protein BO79DRAFT_283826 [Aspergillus costaricaensis CBS 115574]RAK94550.1 hypothetical protein BO79DRAFT_283826 [Aspergillus costaricaensis CBS 115574]